MLRAPWCHETIGCHLRQSFKKKFCEEKLGFRFQLTFFRNILKNISVLQSKLRRETEEEGEGGRWNLSFLLLCE